MNEQVCAVGKTGQRNRFRDRLINRLNEVKQTSKFIVYDSATISVQPFPVLVVYFGNFRVSFSMEEQKRLFAGQTRNQSMHAQRCERLFVRIDTSFGVTGY